MLQNSMKICKNSLKVLSQVFGMYTQRHKTQFLPDSSFLRAKNFWTKRAKPFLATNLKSACLPLMTSGWFWNCLENGKRSGKTWTILTPSENGKWSGKIQTVLKPSRKWEMTWKNPDSLSGLFCYTRKNFPGGNATLPSRFLCLCWDKAWGLIRQR